MSNDLTFTVSSGPDSPDTVDLLTEDVGYADKNVFVKKHPGYPPKIMNAGELNGIPHPFMVRMTGTTKDDVETLVSEWKNLIGEKGSVAWDLSGAGDTLNNCTLMSVNKEGRETPAVASLSQEAAYRVALMFLEADS